MNVISSFVVESLQSEVCQFLSRDSILTRDNDIANLSVCPYVRLSVRYVPVPDENGLTYRHSFLTIRTPIILVLPASNIFTKLRRVSPAGALNTGGA